MVKLSFFILFFLTVSGLAGQELYVTFRPEFYEYPLDSIVVTNLRTNQKVKLLPEDTLFLVKSITIPKYTQGSLTTCFVYPNPCEGETDLIFHTGVRENVEAGIYNSSGQLLFHISQELSAGTHRFRMKFQSRGIFFISVLKSDGNLGFKAVCTGGPSEAFDLSYQGMVQTNYFLDTIPYKQDSVKMMIFKEGDILYSSAYSGLHNTIIADSPAVSKVYSVEFYPCIDADKNSYPIVKTGKQWWMAKNLAFLPAVSPPGAGSETLRNMYVYGYNGASTGIAKTAPELLTYGALYNWAALMNGSFSSNNNPSGVRGICPPGWHVPGDAEWDVLANFLGGGNSAGSGMKKTGTVLWTTPNGGASNSSGFTGLPGGARSPAGTFTNIGSYGYFWSSTENQTSDAWYRSLNNLNSILSRTSGNKQSGFSVRCLKDDISLASVTTDSVTGITRNTAIAGGVVIHDGWTNITERGIVFSLSQNPTVNDSKIALGSGTGVFTTPLTGLLPGTQYYVRAYVVNSQGTAYGDERVFNTDKILLPPTVLTLASSEVTQTSVLLGGDVTDDGNTPVTDRGIVFSLSQNPTVQDTKIPFGTGTGVFSGTIGGLTPGKMYYFRAYALNSQGIAYGNQDIFVTQMMKYPPTVVTSAPTEVGNNSAVLGGNVTDDGNSPVIERGVVFSVKQFPTISDTKVTNGTGIGVFSAKITSLASNITFYFRAYAINSEGIVYGDQYSFTTTSVVIDIDGNVYPTIQIGTQLWMGQNLKTSRYNDGTDIPYIAVDLAWENQTEGAYSWYENNEKTYGNTYGALYNWYAVTSSHNICPVGWHIPTLTDWYDLLNYLGGDTYAGGKMKESGTSHWKPPNNNSTNESGFTGLPAGIRGGFGFFYNINSIGYWWSSTEFSTRDAWVLGLYYDYYDAGSIPYPKQFGLSVRCLKDN